MTLFDLTYPASAPTVAATDGGERLPVIDAQGHVVGSMSRAEAHSGTMRLHPVVHLHQVSNHPRVGIWLQQRSLSKDIQPGRWDTCVGGHVDYGERLGEAVVREAGEELGLRFNRCHISADGEVVEDEHEGQSLEPMALQYVWQSQRERELVTVFFARVPSDDYVGWRREDTIPGEVDDVRFWPIEEIRQNLGKGIFTPQFEQELGRIERFVTKNEK